MANSPPLAMQARATTPPSVRTELRTLLGHDPQKSNSLRHNTSKHRTCLLNFSLSQCRMNQEHQRRLT